MMYAWWISVVLAWLLLVAIIAVMIPATKQRASALRVIVSSVMTSIITSLCIGQYEIWLGLMIAVISSIAALGVARQSWLRTRVTHLFRRYEQHFYGFAERQTWLDIFVVKQSVAQTVGITTREELQSIIRSATFLPHTERDMMLRLKDIDIMTAKDCMTKLSKVPHIAANDTIGPLLLDELHGSGHTVFPVVERETIVGIVRLSSLVDIDKAAAGIDALMHRHIVRLPANTTLLEACHVLLNDGEDYAIVHHNGDIGLLTMSDIVASLLGKPLR